MLQGVKISPARFPRSCDRWLPGLMTQQGKELGIVMGRYL